MKKTAMTIAYAVGSNLYLNLTNRCPCACTFCIRTMGDTAYGSDPLWLEHEPSWEEVKAALDAVDVSAYHEVVFCGFGEPTGAVGAALPDGRLFEAGTECTLHSAEYQWTFGFAAQPEDGTGFTGTGGYCFH